MKATKFIIPFLLFLAITLFAQSSVHSIDKLKSTNQLFEKYAFASPIDQMKHGVSIKDIRCNDGLLLNYKSDTYEPVCLTSEEESQLLREGKIKLRLFMPGTQVEVNLCKIYGGDIRSHSLGEGKDDRVFCDNLEFPLLCDVTGGSIRQDGNCSINHKVVYE